MRAFKSIIRNHKMGFDLRRLKVIRELGHCCGCLVAVHEGGYLFIHGTTGEMYRSSSEHSYDIELAHAVGELRCALSRMGLWVSDRVVTRGWSDIFVARNGEYELFVKLVLDPGPLFFVQGRYMLECIVRSDIGEVSACRTYRREDWIQEIAVGFASIYSGILDGGDLWIEC